MSEHLIPIIQCSPEKVAEFLADKEEAFMAFLLTRNKTDRIAQLEKQLADLPKLQAELDTLKSKQ